MEMFYDDDAKNLVLALIGAKLLDTHPTHRLIVHDWHLHADDATDNKIARQKERYASGEVPRMKRLSKNERDHLIAQYATPCAQNPTELHEEPLPVPEPVPAPVPVPEKDISEAKASSPRTDSGKPDPAEAIYQAYPRKVGHRSAIKAITQAIQRLKAKDMTIREAEVYLYRRVQTYARSPAGNDGPGTPHPSRWFNDERYEDDQGQWQVKNSERGSNGKRQESKNRLTEGAVERVTELLGWGEAGESEPRHGRALH
jgi:hypothetical protein